jgi:methionine synthase II (cobalamin-independent)
MADDFGYHIDHHGSLVRPPALLAARASGMDAGALAAVTDEAVVTLSHELRRLTLNAMCDGQYRRSSFESVVHDQVSGFTPADGPAPLSDLAGIGAARRRAVPDARRRAVPDARALAASGRLAQAEAAPVLATVDRSVFVTLPSPGYLAAAGSALSSAADLDAARAAGAALAAILRDEIAALATDGVL